ncbi:sensor histidine kinase [Geomicrobium sediminis]|uniref:histidine kinase n=1 Tax=Geomicrobium sediminis TaxID=1347788 RepID=A0ABS2PFI8_9BACL|nr:HAMP domain-containing sensor histidine kinase [Geomicrobium sediminis]EZH64191.1 hypothetical protein DH09_00185 [Bacillaceae bacterium JMAK1]MBM7634178.1 signal transduction histidine kinase [Geomicrobium sediminis]
MNAIFYKLSGSILVLLLIVLLPLGFMMNQIFINFNHAHLQEETGELASKYAQLLGVFEASDISYFVNSMSSETAMELVVFNQEGEIIGNSGISGFTQSEEPSTQSEQRVYTDTETGVDYFYSGRRVENTSADTGEVYIFSPTNLMGNSAGQVQNALILSGMGALLLAFGFTFIVSRQLSTPLQEMEKAARQMARGNLDVKVPVTTRDELGSLSQSMNELAHDLKRYRINKQEFFSNVSHEFRTPLSYIQGYSDALKKGFYKDDKEHQRFIEIINDESHRMNRLINDLFELSRMEEERFPLELELVEVENAVNSAVAKIEATAKEKDIRLIVKCDSDIPHIAADAFRLEQIFTNLLQNAVRYTEKGQILVEVNAEHGKVKAIVSDTGKGINTEYLPHIFDRFYRVEKSRARDHGGTGLGLAIVKQLTELQYGSIEVESQFGKGTKFILSFPEAKEGDE